MITLKIQTYGIIGYHSKSTRAQSILSPDFQIALPGQSYNVMGSLQIQQENKKLI